MKKLIIAIFILLCVSCTTTKYIETPVPVETVKTEYVNLIKKDSIFVRDSVDRFVHGDTVYQYKYKYIYKYLNRTDTIIKTDSIEIPVEIKTTEIKEVNKIKWYQKILMYFGFGAILILLYKCKDFIRGVFTKILDLIKLIK